MLETSARLLELLSLLQVTNPAETDRDNLPIPDVSQFICATTHRINWQRTDALLLVGTAWRQVQGNTWRSPPDRAVPCCAVCFQRGGVLIRCCAGVEFVGEAVGVVVAVRGSRLRRSFLVRACGPGGGAVSLVCWFGRLRR
ncbi:hypothetical protein ACQPZ2_00675 [Nocardia pseudovaccinii]|uniref:hypothetical protein n=1 Tax=Nocardia pseudovaccinii TaxID=189540 RepID=UPI003D903F30